MVPIKLRSRIQMAAKQHRALRILARHHVDTGKSAHPCLGSLVQLTSELADGVRAYFQQVH